MVEKGLPLEGIRVLEVANLILLPCAGAMLADFGAEVIKVEQPGRGDINRYYHQLGGNPFSEFPYVFHVDNRNKKSIALNLKEEGGRDILHKLIPKVDVLLTNRRPTVLKQLGLAYEDLKELNPRLIYVLGTGYGERGPESHKPGYDSICYWARSGIESQIFPLNDWLGPLPWGSGDHPSGLAVFGGIMLALYNRQLTGEGARLSVSLLSCGAWANATMLAAQLCGAEFREKPAREEIYYTWIYYMTADQRVFKLCIVNEEKRWVPLCTAIGRPDLPNDPRFATYEKRVENMAELIKVLDDAVAQHELAYWQQKLEEHDIPHSILPDYEQIGSDAQMAANDIFVDVEGIPNVRTVNTPIEIAGMEKRRPGPHPELGQHTREILKEVGYTQEDIDAFAARNVVQQD